MGFCDFSSAKEYYLRTGNYFLASFLTISLKMRQAATIPLAAMTAALGLYQRLGLPPPWSSATEQLPLIIYGGAGAVESYAIKLAQASNIHPLIIVAGNSMQYVESLISREKGDTIIHYRLGEPGLWKEFKRHCQIREFQK